MIHSSETRILARTQNKRRDARIADNRLIQGIIDSDSFTTITNAVLDLTPDDPATGRPERPGRTRRGRSAEAKSWACSWQVARQFAARRSIRH